jgi:uncharacterized membrane protein (UPF0136 family)
MSPTTVLWIYIVLLVAGGIVGFLKAGSRISLVMSLIFAALLSLDPLGIIDIDHYVDILLIVLTIFFGMRFAKSRKFMPGGLMAILSIVALALRHVRF